jgi:hypothetical protein
LDRYVFNLLDGRIIASLCCASYIIFYLVIVKVGDAGVVTGFYGVA